MHRAGTGVPTYTCVHAHIHVHEKNQGGVRQTSGPWTGVLSLVTLPARETWPEHHILKMYVHVQDLCTVHVCTGEMVYVELCDKKVEATHLFVKDISCLQCPMIGYWSGCRLAECCNKERDQV